jgi:hypothetical protein
MTASTREIRAAYRDRARLLHPDRLIDASPRERDAAAAEMAAVNEAWRVLGDGRRRRTYDEQLAGGPPRRHYAETTMDDDGVIAAAGPPSLIRGLPWIVLAFVLLLIFVFTAYAAGGDGRDRDSGTTAPADVGDCVTVDAGAATPVDCRSVNDGQVVAEGNTPADCPDGSEPLLLRSEQRVICIAR